MTRLAFLAPGEKSAFDAPPRMSQNQRAARFGVSEDMRRMVSGLQTDTNKVGFLLQLGYFKASGKFFLPKQFRRKDIKFVKQLLSITSDIDFDQYDRSRVQRHRTRILSQLAWTAFNDDNAALVAEHVQLLAQQQLNPEQIFRCTKDFFFEHHIELPSYRQLSTVITDSFNIVENNALSRVGAELNASDRCALEALIVTQRGSHRPYLTILKHINQALRPKDIQKNVSACKSLAGYFDRFQGVIDRVNLGDPATEFYATWVQKSKLAQLKQFPNPVKLYLHLPLFCASGRVGGHFPANGAFSNKWCRA